MMDKTLLLKFISLGRQCDTVYNIKKYATPDVPTQFFDWSRTDFKCVIDILDRKNVDDLFDIDNLRLDADRFVVDGDLTIYLKNFEARNLTLMYHHDVKTADYMRDPSAALVPFVAKYKRRFQRLIDTIREPDVRLCFVYRVSNDIDAANEAIDFDTDVAEFDRVLRCIYRDVVYCLVVLIEEEELPYIYTKYRDVLKINLAHFLRKDVPLDWMATRFDMQRVYDIIHANAFI